MQFLILNGVNIPIVMNQCKRGEDKIQDVTRSFGGQLRNAARGYRRTWEATALFQDFDVADGFINLINGDGHYWSFRDGPTSDTGMSPVPGYLGRGIFNAATTVLDGITFSAPSTGNDYWSTGGLEVLFSSGTGVFPDCLAWDCQLEDDKWTAMLIVLNGNTLECEPLFFRSDGAVYLAGIRQDYNNTSTATIKYIDAGSVGYSGRVREGVFYLGIDLSLGVFSTVITDMFIVPYVMPDYFIEQLSMSNGTVFPVEEYPSVPVSGEVTSIAYMQKPGSNNAKTVSFKLTEYLPGYKYDPDAPDPVSPFNLPVLRLGGSVLSEGEGEPTRYPEALP